MDAGSWLNTGRFAVRHPRRGHVMAREVILRLRGEHIEAGNASSLAWLEARAQEIPAVARRIAPELWREAEEFGAVLRERGMAMLQALGQDPGAGGEFEFVYWLTRLRQPAVVVETGVAAAGLRKRSWRRWSATVAGGSTAPISRYFDSAAQSS
jgi:hypothetical protein